MQLARRRAKLQLERVGTYLPIRFGTDLKIKIYKFQKIENTKNVQVLKTRAQVTAKRRAAATECN